jgi:phosphopantetheine adenylyltransferase
MKSFKQFFIEQQEQMVILLPGGYKPPTKGHLHMIKSYNDNPQVSKVIVLIGPKEREGVTREHSLELFNLYGVSSLEKVTVEDTKFDNPMVASFEYVEKDPRAMAYEGLTFAIGASDKGDDALRANRLVKYFETNPDKLRPGLKVGIPPIIKALATNGKQISATVLRQAIRNNDKSTIKKYIPSTVKVADFLAVFYK